MAKKLTDRVAMLEAEVAALRGVVLSFMVASARAERMIAAAAVELAETFGDDAEDAGHRAIAVETRELIDVLARMREGGEDAQASG